MISYSVYFYTFIILICFQKKMQKKKKVFRMMTLEKLKCFIEILLKFHFHFISIFDKNLFFI